MTPLGAAAEHPLHHPHRAVLFAFEEVYRGVHNVQAEVLDETGKLMIRSLPNRFYVQQNTIRGR